MKKIKNEELLILEKIFQQNKINKMKQMAQEKIEQQKKLHVLLKIIRDLINNYDNLSQLYNDDENKKILFKSLLLRYGIREKEENINYNLIDKFNELKKSINDEKNKKIMNAKKKEIAYELYKNVINEESSEEGGSVISGKKSKAPIFKKLSWCSEDSIIKEKENYENEHNDEEDNDINDVKKEIIFIKEE